MVKAAIDNRDIAELTFEQAMAALDNILQRLESGEIELAQSIAIYERGELLKKHCENLLKAAELKIEKLKINNEGAVVGTEPLKEHSNSYIDTNDEDLPF